MLDGVLSFFNIFWLFDVPLQVIISFRGTEQVKFKDILTDINLAQVSENAFAEFFFPKKDPCAVML